MERKKETAQTYPVSPMNTNTRLEDGRTWHTYTRTRTPEFRTPEFPSRKGGMVSAGELESQGVFEVTAAGEYDTMILSHQRRLTCWP